jgi:hypothetical protein
MVFLIEDFNNNGKFEDDDSEGNILIVPYWAMEYLTILIWILIMTEF